MLRYIKIKNTFLFHSITSVIELDLNGHNLETR